MNNQSFSETDIDQEWLCDDLSESDREHSDWLDDEVDREHVEQHCQNDTAILNEEAPRNVSLVRYLPIGVFLIAILFFLLPLLVNSSVQHPDASEDLFPSIQNLSASSTDDSVSYARDDRSNDYSVDSFASESLSPTSASFVFGDASFVFGDASVLPHEDFIALDKELKRALASASQTKHESSASADTNPAPLESSEALVAMQRGNPLVPSSDVALRKDELQDQENSSQGARPESANTETRTADELRPVSQNADYVYARYYDALKLDDYYVLDTTAHNWAPSFSDKQKSKNVDRSRPANQGFGQAEHPQVRAGLSKTVKLNYRFEVIDNDWFAVTRLDCQRYYKQLGDQLDGFGIINRLELLSSGTRIYSKSGAYMDSGEFRNCSRAILSNELAAEHITVEAKPVLRLPKKIAPKP